MGHKKIPNTNPTRREKFRQCQKCVTFHNRRNAVIHKYFQKIHKRRRSHSDRLHTPRELLTRLFAQIEISTTHFFNNTPCWDWIGSNKSVGGYGTSYAYGKSWPVHRLLYFMFIHTVPHYIECDHLCRRRQCVNPVHIDAVTSRENLLRSPITLASINKQKTHCIHGHPLSGDNVRIIARGNRSCRTCYKRLMDYHNAKFRSLPKDHPKKIRANQQNKKSHIRLRDKHNTTRRLKRRQLKLLESQP